MEFRLSISARGRPAGKSRSAVRRARQARYNLSVVETARSETAPRLVQPAKLPVSSRLGLFDAALGASAAPTPPAPAVVAPDPAPALATPARLVLATTLSAESAAARQLAEAARAEHHALPKREEPPAARGVVRRGTASAGPAARPRRSRSRGRGHPAPGRATRSNSPQPPVAISRRRASDPRTSATDRRSRSPPAPVPCRRCRHRRSASPPPGQARLLRLVQHQAADLRHIRLRLAVLEDAIAARAAPAAAPSPLVPEPSPVAPVPDVPAALVADASPPASQPPPLPPPSDPNQWVVSAAGTRAEAELRLHLLTPQRHEEFRASHARADAFVSSTLNNFGLAPPPEAHHQPPPPAAPTHPQTAAPAPLAADCPPSADAPGAPPRRPLVWPAQANAPRRTVLLSSAPPPGTDGPACPADN